MILKEDGSVLVTGLNAKGQLGLKDTVNRSISMQVEQLDPLDSSRSKGMAISAGDSHSMILAEDGDVWMAGTGSYGLLGLGPSNTSTTSFTQVEDESITHAEAIAAGDYHSIILKYKNIWGTGSNKSGRLGIEGIPIAEYIFTFTHIEEDASGTNIGTVKAIEAGNTIR